MLQGGLQFNEPSPQTGGQAQSPVVSPLQQLLYGIGSAATQLLPGQITFGGGSSESPAPAQGSAATAAAPTAPAGQPQPPGHTITPLQPLTGLTPPDGSQPTIPQGRPMGPMIQSNPASPQATSAPNSQSAGMGQLIAMGGQTPGYHPAQPQQGETAQQQEPPPYKIPNAQYEQSAVPPPMAQMYKMETGQLPPVPDLITPNQPFTPPDGDYRFTGGGPPANYGANNPVYTENVNNPTVEEEDAVKGRKRRIQYLQDWFNHNQSPYDQDVAFQKGYADKFRQDMAAASPIQRAMYGVRTGHKPWAQNPEIYGRMMAERESGSHKMADYKNDYSSFRSELQGLLREQAQHAVAEANQQRSDRFKQAGAQEAQLAPLRANLVDMMKMEPPGPRRNWMIMMAMDAGVLPRSPQVFNGLSQMPNEIRTATKEMLEMQNELNRLKLFPYIEQNKRIAAQNAATWADIKTAKMQAVLEKTKVDTQLAKMRAGAFNANEIRKLEARRDAHARAIAFLEGQDEKMARASAFDMWRLEKDRQGMLGNPNHTMTPEEITEMNNLENKVKGVVTGLKNSPSKSLLSAPPPAADQMKYAQEAYKIADGLFNQGKSRAEINKLLRDNPSTKQFTFEDLGAMHRMGFVK